MSSLYDPKINNILNSLHKESTKDFWKLNKIIFFRVLETLLGKKKDFTKDPKIKANAFKNIYISIGKEEGKFLYLTAKSIKAKNIIEFGTSFGISTIYLAAAVRDNGGGKVISTEIEPKKIIIAEENIKKAGLNDIVEILKGDATETLQNINMKIDMLFLDGWKLLYLPILKQLLKQLHPNSVIIAEDIVGFKKILKEYIDYVNNQQNGFTSMLLPLGDGMLYSIRTNKNLSIEGS